MKYCKAPQNNYLDRALYKKCIYYYYYCPIVLRLHITCVLHNNPACAGPSIRVPTHVGPILISKGDKRSADFFAL